MAARSPGRGSASHAQLARLSERRAAAAALCASARSGHAGSRRRTRQTASVAGSARLGVGPIAGKRGISSPGRGAFAAGRGSPTGGECPRYLDSPVNPSPYCPRDRDYRQSDVHFDVDRGQSNSLTNEDNFQHCRRIGETFVSSAPCLLSRYSPPCFWRSC